MTLAHLIFCAYYQWPSSLKRERTVAMISALLMRSGGVWPRPSPIPVLEGRSEVSHGLCLFPLEHKVCAVMVVPIPLP